MNEEQTAIVVSLLNYFVEQQGWDVEREGFGYYPQTLEISGIDGDTTDCLKNLWEALTGDEWK